MEEGNKKALINRLRTIKGHINGIEKMIEDEKSCEEVLLQITAVKSSIEKVGHIIVEDHAKDCLLGNINNKEDVERVMQTIIKFIK